MTGWTERGPWGLSRRLTRRGQVVFACIATVIWLLLLLFHPFERDAATRAVMERVRQDAAVVAAVGEPVEIGGPIDNGYDSSSRYIRIPIEGPRGKAVVDAAVAMRNDKWWVDALVLTLPDGTQLNRTRFIQ
jgi:hypothetical protein